MYRKIIGLVLTAAFFLSILACSEKKEAVPLSVFQQEITAPVTSLKLKADEEATMVVTVKNTGNETWPAKGSDKKETNRVGLGFHWLDSAGKEFNEGRAILPNNLLPGAAASLNVSIKAPPEPGDYKLRFSIVEEHVVWFSNKGAKSFIVAVKVTK